MTDEEHRCSKRFAVVKKKYISSVCYLLVSEKKEGASYTCVFYSEEYIAETQRPLRIQLQEHQLQASNRSRYTPWGEHMGSHANEEVAKKPVFSAEIFAIESSATTRKARKAIEIRDRKPTINRKRG